MTATLQKLYILHIILLGILFSAKVFGQTKQAFRSPKNVLYINSYHPTYSWGDSVASGVIAVFKKRPEISLFVEYLDCKRFGQSNFESSYNLMRIKFSLMKFDAVIVSDNDALEFMLKYSNELVPNTPVVFCGIDNITQYNFDDSLFYGMDERIISESFANLIVHLMPDVKTLYFISDSIQNNINTINAVRAFEPKYKGKVAFEYILNAGVDSVLSLVSHLPPKSAIALFMMFRDKDNTPINPDLLVEHAAVIATAPLFVSSETSFGKGIAGGYISSGAATGRAVAALALNFLDSLNFKVKQRLDIQQGVCYLDYKVLARFNIETSRIPEGAIVINMPSQQASHYFHEFIGLVLFCAFLILVIMVLIVNIRLRRNAEKITNQHLATLRDTNLALERANGIVLEMNVELEEINEELTITNDKLTLAKEKAEESDRLKSAFLSNISHEIRTPMNGILGYSSLLVDVNLPRSSREQYVHYIQHSGQYLLKIITDIIEIAKIESRQIAIQSENFNLVQLLAEVFNEYKQKTPIEKSIILYNIGCQKHDSLQIHHDKTKIQYVISTLINNALKYTLEGYVEFGCIADTNTQQLRFYVKDTGIGISSENLRVVFDRFRQLDTSEKIFQTGTGLGLTICKSYVELMQGSIWAESEKDQGSTFWFVLPYNMAQNNTKTHE